jgi:hypothetical protein
MDNRPWTIDAGLHAISVPIVERLSSFSIIHMTCIDVTTDCAPVVYHFLGACGAGRAIGIPIRITDCINNPTKYPTPASAHIGFQCGRSTLRPCDHDYIAIHWIAMLFAAMVSPYAANVP